MQTNGVTPRRWLELCNPALSAVITQRLGSDAWVGDLDLLAGLAKHADDPELQAQWAAAKRANKVAQVAYIKAQTGVTVSPDVMWDIQVKRIHEYKRQLLNILGIVYRYKQMKAMTPAQRAACVPRVCMVGGKAYATYLQAKRIVKLVNAVGAVVNNDPEIGDLLKVLFIPNYNGASPMHAHCCRLLTRPPVSERCREAHPSLRAVAAHQHRRHGGERHQQHEVLHERLLDYRHPGRRKRGDPRLRGP